MMQASKLIIPPLNFQTKLLTKVSSVKTCSFTGKELKQRNTDKLSSGVFDTYEPQKVQFPSQEMEQNQTFLQ
jgi:hypothetical protein